ncbi:low-affinity zinc ion transporter-like protein [Teratosphaeria nubilosa]|uniref:Low-affinity zinc ion transporter-like protein n=1 Tax=Teratosphaeria nubilosa TaxID=161662 RepID=A0A6G1LAS2_9PEZI|nr:low-affinity zinc ion transporter-like protein [Teratosphaeria nubilosa]
MSTCEPGNDYDGRMGVRISSIFVILVGSLLGAWFPVYAARHKGVGVPDWAFFIAKYFGSGVILATAFIHLLAPANEALTDECLTGAVTEYTWVEGICLMVIFAMFVIELMTMRYAKFGHEHEPSRARGHARPQDTDQAMVRKTDGSSPRKSCSSPYVPGDDHLSHSRAHYDSSAVEANQNTNKVFNPDSYAAQMTAIFILEFGVIFHSIFIGLTLAVAGDEFNVLYVVLVFHQTFEGLGLGTRLACVEWPSSKRFTPYLLGAGYAISTPIAIAIGLGVRESFSPGSETTLIANGVFDSISAGILIYTGLIELMAHEFMFSEYMQGAPMREVLAAIGCMGLGAGLMALLGKWA